MSPLMHSRSRCCVSCVGPAVDILAVVKSDVATVGASGQSHRLSCRWSACDKRALKGTQKPLQLFTERHHNPSQAVVFIYVGHSAASLPLSLSLWHREECVEGGRDGWMDGGKKGGGSLLVSLSHSFQLFGEFADDTDQCSIFIFKTLVVRSQVNQNLVVKIELTLKTNKIN